MIWIVLALVTAVAVHSTYWYLKFRKQLAALMSRHSSLHAKYSSLCGKYNRVQHSYNQGVVEGMAKAYANVRTDWIVRLENSTPQERAFLLTWREEPTRDWERARCAMNAELKTITGPDHDVNYADYQAQPEEKKMIKLP